MCTNPIGYNRISPSSRFSSPGLKFQIACNLPCKRPGAISRLRRASFLHSSRKNGSLMETAQPPWWTCPLKVYAYATVGVDTRQPRRAPPPFSIVSRSSPRQKLLILSETWVSTFSPHNPIISARRRLLWRRDWSICWANLIVDKLDKASRGSSSQQLLTPVACMLFLAPSLQIWLLAQTTLSFGDHHKTTPA